MEWDLIKLKSLRKLLAREVGYPAVSGAGVVGTVHLQPFAETPRVKFYAEIVTGHFARHITSYSRAMMIGQVVRGTETIKFLLIHDTHCDDSPFQIIFRKQKAESRTEQAETCRTQNGRTGRKTQNGPPDPRAQ